MSQSMYPAEEEIRNRRDDRWVDAALIDLNAEILRQGSELQKLQRLCQGRDTVSVSELSGNLVRLLRGNTAMHDIVSSVHNIHGDDERAAALQESPHNLQIFLEHFREEAAERCRTANVGFRMQSEGLHDTAVLMDREKMLQVLSNLLNYVLRATSAGGRITLRVTQEGESHSGYGTYLFRTSHTGISLTASQIETLFDWSRRSEASGSAFGISVVKQLSEMMGGGVSVEAVPGTGNVYTVRVSMPLMSSEDSSRIIADKRILVVDDNRLNSELVADLLRGAGAVAEIVSSGEEAVDMVSNYYEGYYDIILTDIQMTGIDGYETARRIREIPWATKKALKIIALSAFEYDEEKDRQEGSSFNAYCMKPFDIRRFTVAAFDGASE